MENMEVYRISAARYIGQAIADHTMDKGPYVVSGIQERIAPASSMTQMTMLRGYIKVVWWAEVALIHLPDNLFTFVGGPANGWRIRTYQAEIFRVPGWESDYYTPTHKLNSQPKFRTAIYERMGDIYVFKEFEA